MDSILFDLDGTLVDSAIETRTILNDMRAERGLGPIEDNHFRQSISYGAGSLIKSALAPRDEDLQPLIDEFRAKYRALTTPRSSIYPTVVETLSDLKARGFKLAVCTNKPQGLCEKVLKDTALESFFECVVAGGPSIKPKPHPDAIHVAISSLGADVSSTVLIGDSTTDQRAAQSAGIPFIFFASGYNDGVVEDQAMASIGEMRDLLTLVKTKSQLI
ncbi:HAD-IA family hydrolase [Magnetovibrio sp.]|uniref:HAD family hydrolase n=1 Tax=Magnetovibrio sp. TaxID=2024836 RepID=UPI002F91FD51